MLDLVILAKRATADPDKVMIGKTIWLAESNPMEGNHPKCTEKARMKRRPVQKVGMETPSKVTRVVILSNKEY
jgi:hypothetical protein